MSYLADSDWVASYLNGRQNAIALLDALMPQGLAISIITFGEIYEGIYYGRDAAAHEAAFLRFLTAVSVLGIDYETARTFARLRGDLRARGLLIPQPDLLIAATALSYDLTLATRNLRHFNRIAGLKLL